MIARPGESERTVRYLRNGHVDGAIVVSHHANDELDRALQLSHVPNVFVGRPLSADERDVQYVDTDNVEGGRLATQHLIDRGCRAHRHDRRTRPTCPPGIDRLTGWRNADARAPGMADDAVVHGDFTMASGTIAARELLARYPDVDAIFIASDLMAAGALSVLAEHGKEVPGDIAVVGYDNLGVAASTTPPLTSVIQPVVAMARAAGARLLDQLNGAPPSPPLIFAPGAGHPRLGVAGARRTDARARWDVPPGPRPSRRQLGRRGGTWPNRCSVRLTACSRTTVSSSRAPLASTGPSSTVTSPTRVAAASRSPGADPTTRIRPVTAPARTRRGERLVRLDGDVAHRHRDPGRATPRAARARRPGPRASDPTPQHEAGHRPVAQDVRLDAQAGRVVLDGEVVGPHPGVVPRGPREPAGVVLRHVGRVLPPADLRDVVRSTGLGAGADGRRLPAAERLALHDRPGDVPVDVRVAHLDALQPVVDLGLVERVQTAREAERDGVLQVDRLVERLDAHDAEHRPEALGGVEPRAGGDAVLHARGPQPALVVELPGRDEPRLPRVERGQRPQQLARRGLGERADGGAEVGRRPDAQGRDGVGELAAQAVGATRGADEDRERRGRALLPGVPEGAAHQVGDGEVHVRGRRDDQRVLAGRLGEDVEVGAPARRTAGRSRSTR